MKRLIIVTACLALTLPLGLTLAAPAMRLSGPAPNVGDAGPTAKAATEIAAYIAAVQPAYTELTECACCCETLDLPSHRCAACETAAATIERIVARIHRVQASLHRVDVPASLVIVHGELVSALSTMHVSGEYMAITVRRTPEKLVLGERVMMGAGLGPPIAWRPSPDIVEDARVEALARSRPDGLSRSRFLHERYAPFADERPSRPQGAPGEQAMAYLSMWRDDVAAQAHEAGLSLPAALAS